MNITDQYDIHPTTYNEVLRFAGILEFVKTFGGNIDNETVKKMYDYFDTEPYGKIIGNSDGISFYDREGDIVETLAIATTVTGVLTLSVSSYRHNTPGSTGRYGSFSDYSSGGSSGNNNNNNNNNNNA